MDKEKKYIIDFRKKMTAITGIISKKWPNGQTTWYHVINQSYKSSILYKSAPTKYFTSKAVVKQGCILSPLRSNIYQMMYTRYVRANTGLQ